MKNKREIYEALLDGEMLYNQDKKVLFKFHADGYLAMQKDGEWIKSTEAFEKPTDWVVAKDHF